MEQELVNLKKELSTYKKLFDDNEIPTIILDLNGKCLDVNTSFLRELKLNTKNDILNTYPSYKSPFKQNDGKKSSSKANEMINIAIEKGHHEFDWQNKDQNNTLIHSLVKLKKIKYLEQDSIKGEIQVITDIELLEEKNRNLENSVKTEIKKSNDFFKKVTESLDKIGEGLFLVEEDFTINYMNNTMIDWFGDQTGKICYKAVAGLEEPCSYCKISDVIQNKQVVEYRPTTPDGQSFEIVATPLNHENNKTMKMEVIRNTTLKVKQEKEISQKSKMIQMGEVMENIAHQWRQPLSVISTLSTGMKIQQKMNILKEEDLAINCDLINKNAQYLSETIDNFRDYIQGDAKEIRFDLTLNLEKCLDLVNSIIKTNSIIVIKDFDNSIEIINYPNVFFQALINVINNAKDALMKNKPTTRYLFLKTYKDNEFAYIEIKDNAGGVPSSIISKLFEVYFTTKHKSQGTGLGLYMTYNIIVNNMNGHITAENETYYYNNISYRGLKFIISLPLTK